MSTLCMNTATMDLDCVSHNYSLSLLGMWLIYFNIDISQTLVPQSHQGAGNVTTAFDAESHPD